MGEIHEEFSTGEDTKERDDMCINERLRDDELRAVMVKLETDKVRITFILSGSHRFRSIRHRRKSSSQKIASYPFVQFSVQVNLQGTTAVEMASGLHWYLKYWCGAHVSWDKTGSLQIASIPPPGALPPVKEHEVMIQRPVPWNYYQNVVTSSYSYVWWDWERWEKEIDWMALQGVNLPLAFTGQETIWQKVFMDFNISAQDLNSFFGGPAFLAWDRMGNLHAWGGPLSQNWLDQQLVLQKQILSRMIELGMTPVLPSFSGNVPAALRKIFPSANITRLGDWYVTRLS